MYRDLLAHLDKSPLLVLPLVALFLFLGVFLATAWRALTDARDVVARAASLPFEEDEL